MSLYFSISLRGDKFGGEKTMTFSFCYASLSLYLTTLRQHLTTHHYHQQQQHRFVGIAFAAFQMYVVSRVSLRESGMSSLVDRSYESKERTPLSSASSGDEDQNKADPSIEMVRIYQLIRDGAKSFLFAEYTYCTVFVVAFGVLLLLLTAHRNAEENSDVSSWDFTFGGLTALSFVIGSFTSILSGYIGMMVAVYANVRTTKAAMDSHDPWKNSFNTAFRAGGVMGFSLCGLALLVLYITIEICKSAYKDNINNETSFVKKYQAYMDLFECVAGFGLGGSSIAMFGRVGGGIYTKAADVGADLAGKVVHGIPEDDPRNPAVIADNVGDNVGDVAGMGSDLFGSFGEATCAALVISSQTPDFVQDGYATVLFPMYISALGIIVCMITSFIATDFFPVKGDKDVEKVLKVQIAASTAIMTVLLYPLCLVLPNEASFECRVTDIDNETIECLMRVTSLQAKAFLCIGMLCVCVCALSLSLSL